MRHSLIAILMSCMALGAGHAGAQGYPSRPVTLIVGGDAGTVPDRLARFVADKLGPALGQAVVVENRAGASGIIGAEAMAHARPDGYTLGLVTIFQAIYAPFLLPRLPYAPDRDFEPVATLATGAMVLAANPSVPAATMKELVGYTRAHPAELFLGLAGLGSPPYVVSALVSNATGLDATTVPHRSAVEAVASAVGGSVQLVLDAPVLIAPQIAAGNLKGIAVTGAVREATLPGVPTLAESGWPDIAGETWMGVVAPRGTPADIVMKVNHEINAILSAPEPGAAMARMGFRPFISSPQEFRHTMDADRVKWGAVIRSAHIKME